MSSTYGPQPPPRRRKGRICQEEGCGKPLSVYNQGKRCYSHDDPRDDRRQTRHNTRQR